MIYLLAALPFVVAIAGGIMGYGSLLRCKRREIAEASVSKGLSGARS